MANGGCWGLLVDGALTCKASKFLMAVMTVGEPVL